MKKRSRFARRCFIESLEDRRLMVGDVSARIDNGNLIVRGDDAANAIEVAAGPVSGQVVVTGVNDASGVATRVNGASNGAVTLSGFTGRIEFEMKNGNDNVSLDGLTSTRTLLDLGKGNDTFEVANHTVTGDMTVKGGDGDDTYRSNSVTCRGQLEINLGKGTNELRSVSDSIARDARYSGGDGTDQFQFFVVTFGGKLTVDMGDGQDLISLSGNVHDFAAVKGGGGDDYFEIGANFQRNLLMDGGGGNNRLNLFGGNAERDVQIRAGSGNDEIRVEDGVILGKLSIDAGDGANLVNVLAHRYSQLEVEAGRGMDSVRIDNEFLGGGPTVVIRSVEVELGDGTNSVEVANITVTGETEIEGGDGNDTLNVRACQFGSFEAELGNGANSFHFQSSTVQRNVEFEAGGGNDSGEISGSTIMGNTTVNLGNGNNGLLYLNESNFHGDVAIRGGNGSDLPSLYLVHIFKSLKVDFGGGGNALFIQAVSVDGRAEFLGGNDVDNYEINFLSSTSLNVAMGKGNDELRISSTSTTQLARFDGGDGQDTFRVADFFPNNFATLERKSFETFGTYHPQ